MANLQKTIKGLRCHSEPKFGPDEYFCETCPYDEATCGLDVPNDALSLLKAHEPRVMTPEEAAKNAYSYYHTPDSVKPVFVQFRDKTYSDEGLTPPMARRCESKGIAQRTGQIRQGFCILDRPPIRRTDGRGGMGWNIRN